MRPIKKINQWTVYDFLSDTAHAFPTKNIDRNRVGDYYVSIYKYDGGTISFAAR